MNCTWQVAVCSAIRLAVEPMGCSLSNSTVPSLTSSNNAQCFFSNSCNLSARLSACCSRCWACDLFLQCMKNDIQSVHCTVHVCLVIFDQPLFLYSEVSSSNVHVCYFNNKPLEFTTKYFWLFKQCYWVFIVPRRIFDCYFSKISRHSFKLTSILISKCLNRLKERNTHVHFSAPPLSPPPPLPSLPLPSSLCPSHSQCTLQNMYTNKPPCT